MQKTTVSSLLQPLLKPLRKHSWIIGASCVLLVTLVVIAGQLYRAMVVEPSLRQVESITETYAAQQASAVSKYVRELPRQMVELAGDQSLIDELATANGTVSLGRWEDMLRRSYPNALQLQIISAGSNIPDQGNNFAALDLLRRTLKGESTAPEAVKVTGDWSLLLTTPIVTAPLNGDGQIIGAVLVGLPISDMQSALAATPLPLPGVTRIYQSARNAAPQSFASVGQASTVIASAKKDTQIPTWHVVFSAGPPVRDLAETELGPFALAAATATAVTALLIALVVHIGLRRHCQNIAARSRKIARSNGSRDMSARQIGLEETDPVNAAEESAPEASASKVESNQGSDIFELEPPPPVDENVAPSSAPQTLTAETASSGEVNTWPEAVFRNYDIRGLADREITPPFAETLGKVLGSRVLAQGEQVLAVGADGRNSSPALTAALINGVLSTGCDVIDLGQVPTPLLNFALHHLSRVQSGVMVTASHNPANYNGFKFVLSNRAISGDAIALLRQQMIDGDWAQGEGELKQHSIVADYLAAVVGDVTPVQNLHVVLDCANGVAGPIAVPLLEALGCQVSPLYCEVDGNFPNHPPDPTVPAHLADLITMVKHQNADLGIALDGDGDRLVVVTASGRIIWPDELLMVFARDILKRHPGADVIFDVKSTRRLNALIGDYGGRPVMWRTGHAHVRNKIRETGAPIGGEFSGHLFFNDRWFGFDDGLYATARLLETLTLREQSLDELVGDLEPSVTTPEIKISIADGDKFQLIKKIVDHGQFEDGKLITIDGLRVDFADGWGLVRASNTTPALTLRFEATTETALARIKQLFRAQLAAAEPSLNLEPLT